MTKIKYVFRKAIENITGTDEFGLNLSERLEHGDFATNVAMLLAKKDNKNPHEFAEEIANKLRVDGELTKYVRKIEVVEPGFINFFVSFDILLNNMIQIITDGKKYGISKIGDGKKYMFEFAHPNTHKEMHIGHMRTLILGESLSRLFEYSGHDVFRANYQGDIGPHVAKAIWGTQKLLDEKSMTWEMAEDMNLKDKAKLLGDGYVRGNEDYENNKEDIDKLNIKLYEKNPDIKEVYRRTRKWSLDYYDFFYRRFYTKFDKLYFESEVDEKGKKIVLKNIGKVFDESEGAIIFDGEKYGLHKRVFVTKEGYPTYEGKEMALGKQQYTDFKFDRKVHVVANEQAGYFQVVIKAKEMLFPELKDKEIHLSMGMVNLVGKKMSSRKGVVIRVDDLIDEIKQMVDKIMKDKREEKDTESIKEIITIGAIKYSMLKTAPGSNVLFDLKKSIDIKGNSGPYLQYTYARTQSVINKLKTKGNNIQSDDASLNDEERELVRMFIKFPEVIEEAIGKYAPNLICNYLFSLAQSYNNFYNTHKIIGDDNEKTRIKLTRSTGQILENGLNLLGIKAPKKM